jgi:hypothetical protein
VLARRISRARRSANTDSGSGSYVWLIPATTYPWLASSSSSAAYTSGGLPDGENTTTGHGSADGAGTASGTACGRTRPAWKPIATPVARHSPGRYAPAAACVSAAGYQIHTLSLRGVSRRRAYGSVRPVSVQSRTVRPTACGPVGRGRRNCGSLQTIRGSLPLRP